MGYDYFTSENEQRAIRYSDAPGLDTLKHAMSYLHGRAAAQQWRASGNYKLPDAWAYAILARCAARVATA